MGLLNSYNHLFDFCFLIMCIFFISSLYLWLKTWIFDECEIQLFKNKNFLFLLGPEEA